MIPSSIMFDGVEYVPKQQSGEIKIIVLDKGFVYIGRVNELDDRIEVKNAKNIIRWGTKGHLGELVGGPLINTKLGDPCNFIAYRSSVVHMIDIIQDQWDKKL